jgi:phosphoserine phosphatase RsbU/P
MTPSVLSVRQAMQADPVLVPSDCPVRDVLDLMNLQRIGSVLVVDPTDRLLGIFTERDLLRRVATAETIQWRDLPVSQWMTTNPHTIEPELGWEQAIEAMQRLKVRHLPVLEDGRVIGLVSTRILMASRAEYLNERVDIRTGELRRSNEALMARDSEVLHNLRAAGRLQTKLLLPHTPPDWPELKWAFHYAALDHLGGDYYDFATPGAEHLGILIADASGHSVAAAMVAVMARFAFGEVANDTISPGQVLSEMNRRLMDVAEERFVTAFYGVLNRRTRVFRYSNAGHPYPVWYQAKTGTVKEIAAQGFLLGIMPDEVYSEREVILEPGDAIAFHTDGLVEARNEIGEQYGSERLMECMSRAASKSETTLRDEILADQREFSSNVPLSDDLTLVVCRVE